jgi:hypothetical protein
MGVSANCLDCAQRPVGHSAAECVGHDRCGLKVLGTGRVFYASEGIKRLWFEEASWKIVVE